MGPKHQDTLAEAAIMAGVLVGEAAHGQSQEREPESGGRVRYLAFSLPSASTRYPTFVSL